MMIGAGLGPGAMPGPLCYATPVPADELAAWIDELRRRLDAGELGETMMSCSHFPSVVNTWIRFCPRSPM